MQNDGPIWAKGYPLPMLRTISDFVKEFDGEHTRGQFSRLNDARVADALAAGHLRVSYTANGSPTVVAVMRQYRRGARLTDFRGERVARANAGDWVCDRVAYVDIDEALDLIDSVTGDAGLAWLWGHPENPPTVVLAREYGMLPAVRRVAASSELTTCWGKAGDGVHAYDSLLPGYEWPSLVQMPDPPDDLYTQAVAEVENLLPGAEFTDHYSTYNRAHTWSALSLRGYGDESYIVKPAEMSQAWRRDHEDALAREVRDTPLWDRLSACAGLARWASGPGGEIQRVRLMRLAAGGGELARHADIIDLDSGPEDGKVIRIHIPLLTNPDVIFRGWELDGRPAKVHMGAGEAWYLDTRKPHTAINGGSTERIHLVCDVYATDAHRDILGRDS